jgi:hypothetical protein
LPGIGAPRITVKHQGAYHLTSAYVRAGSWAKGIFIVEVDSREKRIEVPSYSYASFGTPAYGDEVPGVAEVCIGPRGDGDSTIFYTEDDAAEAPEDVDIDAWTTLSIQFPRPWTTRIPTRLRKLLRIPAHDWHFSVDENYDKYGFVFIAYRYRGL